MSIVEPARIDGRRVRASLCNPQRFFPHVEAARGWQTSHPGMAVLPITDVYQHIAVPIAWWTLGQTQSHAPR